MEDIIDTGRTMSALLAKLNTVGAKSVQVTSLFLKRTPLSNGYVPDCKSHIHDVVIHIIKYNYITIDNG